VPPEEGGSTPHVEPHVASIPDQLNLWDQQSLQRAQLDDPDISFIYELVLSGAEKPAWDDVSSKSRDAKVLWSFWPRLSVKNGILMRKFESEDGRDDLWQVILPKALREQF